MVFKSREGGGETTGDRRKNKKVGKERQRHCKALRGYTNYISHLNTGDEGKKPPRKNPCRSKQNRLYHFDIKQGEEKLGSVPHH